jgi:hypothetical protein
MPRTMRNQTAAQWVTNGLELIWDSPLAPCLILEYARGDYRKVSAGNGYHHRYFNPVPLEPVLERYCNTIRKKLFQIIHALT